MVLLHTPPGELGAPAAVFTLPGVDGRDHSLGDYAASRALLVMFLCNHCPYVIAIQQRLIALANEMIPQGAAIVAINSNDAVGYPDDNFASMQRVARELNYPFDYLFD
ncbi:redoxin domain-containing protein [Magnetofaba australis]|uniref:Putative Redoxin domain protein n=1 Tax=Magnetofaba australis IT-1 TaxID=1434232 RepID=A0A1Y2K3F6_9PROT|nr:redoxin domain-containing protein [Magnetofaba australis]OSM02492.1 putative Redoxin domain protein [Magnetofaba australis IT-1]